MKGRYRKAFDIFGIGVLLSALAVIVWLSSDGHIYFSQDSGYYKDTFTLEINGSWRAGNKVYYTLDGSEPTQEDYLYDKGTPILIGDATSGDNRYADRQDVGISDFVNNTLYEAPDYNIDKCNVVRASVFDGEGNCLDSITGIYFVGFQGKTGYDGIYTASIVTDPENLFDPETGIYVKGFEENANYAERGPEWEREASLAIYDDKQRQILTQQCGIRIKGGTSRRLAQKSIRCYARDEYCGDNKFQTELFHKGKLPHRIVFYAGGNDYFCKVKDPMIHELTESLHFATMRFIPCVLFLNGEYWGVYYLSEEYDDDYIADHYDVKEDNVVLIKSGWLKEGEDSDFDEYLAMKEFITQEDMSRPENWETACQMIDMDSFIDYYATQIYIQRHEDWPSANYALWRTREDEGSEFGDGRWRWMLYDVNSGGMDVIEYDSILEVLYDDGMFCSLYYNEEFRRRFAERILYIGRDVLSAENCSEFLKNYGETMKIPMTESNRRFYPAVREEDFDGYLEWLTEFFDNRYDAIWDVLVENMGEEWLRQNGIEKELRISGKTGE